MPREPCLQAPPFPRLLGWRKSKRCGSSAGVSLSSTSMFPPCICICAGVVDLAEVRDEVHQRRLVKEPAKGLLLQCLSMNSPSPP